MKSKINMKDERFAIKKQYGLLGYENTLSILATKKSAENHLKKNGYQKAHINTDEGVKEFFIKEYIRLKQNKDKNIESLFQRDGKMTDIVWIEKQVPKTKIEWEKE